MKLIDADALWTDIMMLPHNGDMISSEEVEQAIKDAPAVDAAPVVHGYWKQTGKHFLPYQCSACESEEDGRTYYCPNCGGKMDGREDNEA